MNQPDPFIEDKALDADYSPLDMTRENAAYEKARERLLRDHRGRFALIHGDEVVGIFATEDQATLEGYRRFGPVQMLIVQIGNEDAAEYIRHVDINHPSFRRID
jgi:hypothetical protein